MRADVLGALIVVGMFVAAFVIVYWLHTSPERQAARTERRRVELDAVAARNSARGQVGMWTTTTTKDGTK